MANAEAVSAAAQLDEALSTIHQQGELIQRLMLEKYEPIAVVGVGLRFPGGSNSLDEFTEFLRDGRSATVPVPEDRWDMAAFTKGAGKGSMRAGAGGFLDRIDQFDAKFFNISPKEANWVDPQQRLILETAWEALENANIDPTALRHGNGGVYMAASALDYAMELEGLGYDELDGHVAAGVSHSAICGRLSYFLGWRGPSICVDTACSASLVALHQAVEGLRRGECEIALCGGVNTIHHPRGSVLFSDMEALSPDGRCKTFDDSADGYGRAEGCGVLVLKRMSDAKRDGDTVLALVRGTAVAQDGESAGLHVPNGTAQEAVMRRALAASPLEPSDIQYVEAHGTGTPLGDPIEMGAISDVFGDSHSVDAPVVVGSHKTNIGHLEPAAGIAGIVKTVAQLRNRTIFPHVNFHTPSTRIPWANYPVTVPTECLPWEGQTRRALVNSFGFTGTIASAVLEEAPPSAAPRPAQPSEEGASHVFTLSAKSKKSLGLQIERYQRALSAHLGLGVGEICYTGHVGRAHFPHRVSGVVRDREELDSLLADRLALLERGGHGESGGIRKVAFLFTGQGAQYAGMGAGLYRRHPEFRRVVDECDKLFAPHLGRSVKAVMFGGTEDPEEINRTRSTQPALFVLEYALAKLWLSWGVRPSTMIGHSIGEIVAATVAGLFDLPDAVELVAARARLMDSVSAPGGMAAVRAAVETVEPLVEKYPDLAIAAVNTPSQCVVSGGREALDDLVGELEAQGVRIKRLSVSQAFHSPLMNEVAEEFRAVLEGVTFHEPELSFVSNLTGELARWRQISRPDYWVRHLTEPVDFMTGIRTAERRGPHVFIEIGPASTLSALAKRCVAAEDQVWLTSLRPAAQDDGTLLKAVAQLYETGIRFSWPGFHGAAVRGRVALPTYAFDHKRYWLPLTDRPRPADDTGTRRPASAPAPVAAAAAAAVTLDPAALTALEAAERRAALTDFIRGRLALTLDFGDIDEVEKEANFSELGLDSLAADELRAGLMSALGITFPVSTLFDHPTAGRLAAYVDQQLVPS
ncbi:type I polyketide synthase [Streptomyces sp. NPDC088116]|uniref:type I polyketide synthase n=1 Tax=Streptomyces sp. NPDC088116 TaxID=3365825 RepID=UPI00380E4A30